LAAEESNTRPKKTPKNESSVEKPSRGRPPVDNPFPPGYAEDLLDGDDLDESSNPFPPGYGEDLQK
jgi:hypothetical protein